ncbi:MAG: GTPase [Woeseiaceae bacterium]|nr:GTPase [Woeseiaceae bacterium]
MPAADVAISAVGGSTLDIRHFRWQNDNGVEVLLTDVPGTAGIDTGLDRVAEQEARRAHVVLFVCDGDLDAGRENGRWNACWHLANRWYWF